MPAAEGYAVVSCHVERPLDDQVWRLYVALNPVTMPVECFRYLLLGIGSTSGRLIAVSIVATLATLASGILVFRQVEKTFVDVA